MTVCHRCDHSQSAGGGLVASREAWSASHSVGPGIAELTNALPPGSAVAPVPRASSARIPLHGLRSTAADFTAAHPGHPVGRDRILHRDRVAAGPGMTGTLLSPRVPQGTLRRCSKTPNLHCGPLNWLPETRSLRCPESAQIVDSGRFLVSTWRSLSYAWRHCAQRARAVLRSCAIHIVAWGFLCVGCWPVPARAQVAADTASATKPNIVIILADDLGWGDVRAMRPESTLPTPRIDSIAAAGMRFTDAHSAAAVCSPSRYAILTGRYGWRSYLSSDVLGDHSRPLIESDVPTLGSMLQQHGYRTAAIGKWHLGLRFPRLPPG